MMTPAGWYDDGSGRLRWWDGSQWTEHVADMPLPAAEAAGPGAGPASAQPRRIPVLGLIGLGAAVIGVVLACIPPMAAAGWVMLGAAFVLSLISLFLRGPKWPGIVGLGVTLLGAVLAGAVSLLSLGLGAGTEAVDAPVAVQSERPSADDDAADDPSEDPSAIKGAEMVMIAELEVGDCIPLVDYEDEVHELPVVACDQPHTDEVYFIYEAEDGEFPGDDALSDAAWTRCLAEFETFIGIPYEDSEFDVYSYQPTESSWKRWDDREIQCIVYSFEDVTGTLKGSAR